MTISMPPRYDAQALRHFGASLLAAAGMPDERAAIAADVLVEGDLLGQTTHGLAQLPKYLDEIGRGTMAVAEDWAILADHGSTVHIDACRLSGPWIVRRAFDLALERSAAHGVVTIAIKRAHHIAALSAYLPVVAEAGKAALLIAADPSSSSVAPLGGTRPIYSPNPIAAVFPTSGDPILIDISMSAATMGLVGRRRAEGRLMDDDVLLDNQGRPTRDPTVMSGTPRGSIQPSGGASGMHKGYALGIIVEALANALGGHGRSMPSEGWGTSVFLQVIDPTRFAGSAPFLREMDWFADAVANNPPADPTNPARLPGARALKLRREQTAHGVALHNTIMPALAPHVERLGVTVPQPLQRPGV